MNTKQFGFHTALVFSFFSILSSCASNQGVVFAHSGDLLTAEGTITPTIDGVISPGEWDDADSLFAPLEYLDLWPDTTMHEATLYVKNDEMYLYLAAVVEDDDYDPNWLDFGVWWFENDHDGVVEVGDDGLVIRSDGLSTDVYRPNTIEDRWVSDVSDGGTDDIVGAVSHTNPGGVGDYTFEYRHPLDTADDAHDFSLRPGDTVGFHFQYVNGSEGRGNEIAYSLVQTDDGGYALAGYAGSFGTLIPTIAQYGDFFLVKTNSTSNAEWGRTYGGGGLEVALSMVQTFDGGYALAGYTNSSGAGGYDLWMVKTDRFGNPEWSRTYGGGGLDAAWSLIQTFDGGYALAGVTDSYGAGSGDFWLIKTDPSGNREWSRTYGGENDDAPSTVVQTFDGGYALAGYTNSFGAARRDFWLVKTDPMGNAQWNQTYSDLYEVGSTETAYSLIQTDDGGYALAGYTESPYSGDRDFVLIKTYSNGTEELSQRYGGLGHEIAYSLVQTFDGGYALAGYTNSSGAGGYDFWLVKTDPSLNPIWSRTYSDSYAVGDNEIAYSLVQTFDGGYALAGVTQWFGAVSYDFWLVKTDSNGTTQWDWAYARSARAQWPGFPNYGDIVIAEPSPTQYTLTIDAVGSGSTNPAVGVLSYPSGTVVNVTAVPASGWRFTNWLLDGSNVSANPSYSVTMNAAHTLVAIFEENIRPVATIVSINPSSGLTRASEGEAVSFSGSGYDSDGFVVAYRWTSSIDGLLSNSRDFSTSSLSVGNHTIYFEVQDNNGLWSVTATQALLVEREIPPIPLDIVLTVTAAGFVGSTGVGTFIHFHGKLQSSINIKNKLQKELKKETEKGKNEEKEEKRERDKGKPYLHLETEFPSRIMEATSYNVKLKITNKGQRQAEGIVVTSACTPGLQLCETPAEISALQCGETQLLTFPLASSERLRKGVYRNRFEAKCKDALSRVKTCHTRAVKIGVLSGKKSPKASKQLKDWLRRESYVFSELDNADNLMGGLLNYDLLVLTPNLELPKKWIRNISSFVRNGQSLCVIDRIITDEQKLLAEILGYSGIQYKLIKCDHSALKICNNEHFVPGEFALGEEIEIGKSRGNFCLSRVETGKVLAEYYITAKNRTQADVDVRIPAVTTNEYGKGKVVHFNFRAEKSADRLNKVLGKTFNWLLS